MNEGEVAVVGDRYELLEPIGAGGSGTVFRARDRVLGREVAVKRMRTGADDDAKARLRIEARLAGLLAHPGIARIHDFGEERIGDETAPYLVLEHIDGGSLRSLLEQEAPLAPDRVMGLVAQVADALAVAHDVGIVHRDVKPSNILVRRDGTTALVDFGIARSPDVEPVTQTGAIVGTVDYLSPEQAGGAGATALSDLYSLGLVAYECLTGERPLRRETQIATVMAHLSQDVPPLPSSLPGPVRDVVHRLAARDPAMRPADAATAARLARAAIGATTALPAPVPPGRPGHPGGRRRLALGALAGAAVLAIGVVGVGLVAGEEAPGRSTVRRSPSVGLSSVGAITEVDSVATSATAVAPTPVVSTPPASKPRPAVKKHQAGHKKAHPKHKGKPKHKAHGRTKGHRKPH